MNCNKTKLVLVCCLVLILGVCVYYVSLKLTSGSKSSLDPVIELPDYFLLGASTSAFQSEGALDSIGESYMQWLLPRLLKYAATDVSSDLSHKYKENATVFNDTDKSGSFTRIAMQKLLKFNTTADVSSDSYHKYKEDAKVASDIGLHLYRFSINWPRLLPTGGVDNVNEIAVAYYHSLLNELNKIGVQPMVMLYHWDHPLVLEKSGGWLNDTIVQRYVEYARFVFQEFGNKTKYFITFNEPKVFCNMIYSGTFGADLIDNSDKLIRTYACGHNILKAHAQVYHAYHNHYNPDGKGMISINIECENYQAKHKHDHLSADIAFEFGCGWFAHPIFSKSGDYPKLMKQWVQRNSKLNESKLPTLSQQWINKIRGSCDFFGLSYYSSHLVESIRDNSSQPNFFFPSDAKIILSSDPNWIQASNGLFVVPSGLRSILQKIKEEYDSPTIFVIENGYANTGRINDTDRIKFLFAHIKEIVNAIKHDHCDVRAYLYWSLIDSFEFMDGYTANFGLAHVDFDDPNRPRTLRQSALWLRKVIQSRKLSINY